MQKQAKLSLLVLDSLPPKHKQYMLIYLQ